MQQQRNDNCNRQQIPSNIFGPIPFQTMGSPSLSRIWNACQQQQHHTNNYGYLPSSYPLSYSPNHQRFSAQRSLLPAWQPCRQQQLDNSRFFHSPSSRRTLPPFYHNQNYHHHQNDCCGYRMTIANNASIIGVCNSSTSGSLDTFLKPRPPHSRDIVPKFYKSVIDDVIASIREVFLDDGIDEQVIQDLKQTWERKVLESRAVEHALQQAQAQAASPSSSTTTSGTSTTTNTTTTSTNSSSKAEKSSKNSQKKDREQQLQQQSNTGQGQTTSVITSNPNHVQKNGGNSNASNSKTTNNISSKVIKKEISDENIASTATTSKKQPTISANSNTVMVTNQSQSQQNVVTTIAAPTLATTLSGHLPQQPQQQPTMFRASAIVQNTHSLQQQPQSQHGFIGMTTSASPNGGGPHAGTPTLLQVSSSISPTNSSLSTSQKTNKRQTGGSGGDGKHVHHTLASGMIIGSMDVGGGGGVSSSSNISSHIGIGSDGMGNSNADARGSFNSPLSTTTTSAEANTSSSQGRSTFKNVNSLAISSSDNNFNTNRHYNSDIININSSNNHKRMRMDIRPSNKRQSNNNSQKSIHNPQQQINLNDLADAAIISRMNSQDGIGNHMAIGSGQHNYPVSQSIPINLSTATNTNRSLIYPDRTATGANAHNHHEQMVMQQYLNSFMNQPSSSSPFLSPYVATSSSNSSTSTSGQFLDRNTAGQSHYNNIGAGGGAINIGIGGGTHMSNNSHKVEVKFPSGMLSGTHKLIMLPNNMGPPGTGTFVINQDLLNSINLQHGNSILHAAPGGQPVFQQGLAPGTIPYAIRTAGVQPNMGITTTPLQQIVRGQVLSTLPQTIPSVLTSGAQQQQQQSIGQQQQSRPSSGAGGRVAQLDGYNDQTNDSSDDSNDDDDLDDYRDNDDDLDGDDDEMNDEENEAGVEEEPLNSEDDVSDEDPVELFETDNVVVCQYDKVTRTRNKWKFYFKDGIMNLKGKDYVFSRALGDAEW
ncbi:uncharacterized protein LOC142645129 isoform X1 [Dermatophagoides pteronyssinus]|uniref:uncharacterized protein LOC142645129 isoform X1 n=1 Tax=Dermatophagoides pteronyssinus TaxID=6956 RepID=UPI003F67132F